MDTLFKAALILPTLWILKHNIAQLRIYNRVINVQNCVWQFFLNNSKIPLGLIFVAHPVDEH